LDEARFRALAGCAESSLGGPERPLAEILASHPADALPEEDSGGRIKWAAGALDGIMGHHAGRGDATNAVKRVVDSLETLLERSSGTNLDGLHQALCADPLLSYVDQLLPAIEGAFPSE
jgi:hypothetical protein